MWWRFGGAMLFRSKWLDVKNLQKAIFTPQGINISPWWPWHIWVDDFPNFPRWDMFPSFGRNVKFAFQSWTLSLNPSVSAQKMWCRTLETPSKHFEQGWWMSLPTPSRHNATKGLRTLQCKFGSLTIFKDEICARHLKFVLLEIKKWCSRLQGLRTHPYLTGARFAEHSAVKLYVGEFGGGTQKGFWTCVEMVCHCWNTTS